MKTKTLNEVLKLLNEDSNMRSLVQGSPICHKILDPELNLQFMSKSGIDALEIEKIEDFYNKRFPPPNSPKITQDKLNSALNLAKEGKVCTIEYHFDITDTKVWYQTTITPFFNEEKELEYIRVDSMNISERKLAEDELRSSEDLYRTIAETIPGAVYKCDMDWTFLFASSGFEELTGFPVSDVINNKVRPYVDLMYEDDIKHITPSLNEALKRKDPLFFSEYKLKTKSGKIKWVYDSVRILYDKEDNAIGYGGVLVDITERKKAEEGKRNLEEKLQRAQKMESLGLLAGGVAHDLNNILGGLVSYPELLLLQLPEDSPLRKSILTIQKSGEKAAAVVQDLLSLARRGVVVTEVVNLNNVISEYLKSSEHEKIQSYHPGVHIETRLEADILNILGSSTHLSKTVMNLVSNAAEAMTEGGNLIVSTENRYIDKPIKGYDDVREGDYVVLTISDTGTGIASDDLNKIFEPFYTKKKMGRSGTGLGMAVVWGTVKDNNGYIDVQSTEGKGTTFTLYFPVTRKKFPEDESSLSVEAYSGDGESILIVDDVEEQRKIASGMLEELGYSVVSVSSGEKAVEYLKTNKVDLLVLDMIMDPGMDGLDTYKKILEIHPEQKAIIGSGFSETDRVKETLALGAGAYIGKPFLLEKIGLAVKEELEK